MDPEPVYFSDCIESCQARHPVTQARCTLIEGHTGDHDLEHSSMRTYRMVKRNAILSSPLKRRWDLP